MIKPELLQQFGAVYKSFQKGEMIFQEGEKAVFYYQVVQGTAKMNNYTADGQEIIQGLFKTGESFGEPAILGDFTFPANAQAVEDLLLICLEKNRLMQLLTDHVEVSLNLLSILSNRLRFKAILAREMKGYEAEHRIMTLLQYLKKKAGQKERFLVDITRQTIANLTGLRVETVIRAIKSLEEKGTVQIEHRKLYL
ncbi:MAG: Crp/Fnr family transcriptional regulator [Bacteroidota bacterium]